MSVKKPIPPPDEVPVLEHPLFPAEEGERIPDIHFITICRWERGKAYTGQTVPAGELTDVSQIFALYGGGDYVLQGRKKSITYEGQPGQIVRQKKVNVPGKSRPMSGNPTEEELGELPVAARRAEAAPPGGLSGGDGLTQVMLAMFQSQQTAAQQAQQQAQQQSQQFMQMMVAMMQGSKSESAQMTQMMMTMSAQQSQNMMQMVTAMMANRGGGPEEFGKYAELMRGLGLGGKGTDDKPEDVGSLIENVADIVTGIASMRGGGTLPPAEPGSAVSVLEAMQQPKTG